MKTTILSILILVMMSSCADFVDDDYTIIPKWTRPHIHEFFRIAKSKNLNIDSVGLKIFYKKFSGTILANSTPDDKIIRIDTTTLSWKLYREALIFHELGHVYLHRGHRDDFFVSGRPKSIMNSIQLPIYTDSTSLSTNPDYRKYYINELFNENEPTPYWDK